MHQKYLDHGRGWVHRQQRGALLRGTELERNGPRQSFQGGHGKESAFGCATARPSTSSRSTCATTPPSTACFSESRFDAVLHLAAQVAVTTSVADPRTDFAVNALGTFNMLDAVRLHCPEAVFIFASTNKVYGKIASAATELRGNRYAYSRPAARHQRDRAAGFPFALRLLEGRRRPVRPRLRQDLRICRRRRSGSPASTDRASSAWRTRAGSPGSPSPRCSARDVTIFGDGKQVRDVLLRRRSAACLRGGDPLARQGGGAGLQHRRRPAPRAVPARADRDAGGAPRPQDDPALGRLAPGRPAGLRQRHPQARGGCWAGSPTSASRAGVRQLIDWVAQNRHVF